MRVICPLLAALALLAAGATPSSAHVPRPGVAAASEVGRIGPTPGCGATPYEGGAFVGRPDGGRQPSPAVFPVGPEGRKPYLRLHGHRGAVGRRNLVGGGLGGVPARPADDRP